MRKLTILTAFGLLVGLACLCMKARDRYESQPVSQTPVADFSRSSEKSVPRVICGKPLRLHVGTIDPQFSLNREQVGSLIAGAAREWQDATGRRWFVFAPEEGVAVNFLFDGRQADLVANAKERAELEAELAEAKSQGSVPPPTARALSDRLEKYRARDRRLKGPVPWAEHVMEAGIESIDVFAFSDTDQLHAILLHELGHALGLAHLPQPEAIMNAVHEVGLSDVHLSVYDIEAALSLCGKR